MPLPLPDLDTRRWADLVQEGQALIPRHAPSWSDHNVHDPGITLIELFAWLVEQDIYRANRIPDRHRLEFLTLIGFAPRGPRPSRTMLAFAPPLGTENLLLSAGFQFEGTDTEGHAAHFSTLRDLTVANAALEAVQVREHDSDGALITSDRTRQWRARFPVPVLGSNPQPGAAFCLGFSELPAGVPITLAFRFDGPRHDESERLRIIAEAEAQRRACRPVMPDVDCGTDTSDQEIAATPPHHSARIVWEASTGTGPEDWTALDAVAGLAPPGPGGVMDDTRSLTLDGIVEINLPGALVKTTVGSVATDLFYVRARLVSGAYDTLPVLTGVALNAVGAEQAVPVWQTFVIAASVVAVGSAPTFPSPAPQFAVIPAAPLAIEFDSAGLIQALTFGGGSPGQPVISVLGYAPPTSSNPGHLTVEMILAGFGTGRPDQHFVLPGAPLEVESLRLYSHDGASWQEWLRVPDFDASARTDFHVVIDAVTGEASFGDGERGRVAPPDAILATYRTTRGQAGSLDAGTISRHAATPHNDTLVGGWLPQAGGAGQLSTITTNVWDVREGEDAEDLTIRGRPRGRDASRARAAPGHLRGNGMRKSRSGGRRPRARAPCAVQSDQPAGSRAPDARRSRCSRRARPCLAAHTSRVSVSRCCGCRDRRRHPRYADPQTRAQPRAASSDRPLPGPAAHGRDARRSGRPTLRRSQRGRSCPRAAVREP